MPPAPPATSIPVNPQPGGAQALATLLTERGIGRDPGANSSAAAARAATAGPASQPVTLLITEPGAAHRRDSSPTLARVPGNRVIAQPGPRGAGHARPAGQRAAPGYRSGVARRPAATLPAARSSPGRPDLGGSVAAQHVAAGARFSATRTNGHPSLMRYTGRRTGPSPSSVPARRSPTPGWPVSATRRSALNLLGARPRLVWLVPGPPPRAGGASGPGTVHQHRSARRLAGAAPAGRSRRVLAALWRGRRLGPIVAERLPVVVRAAETVEGHGRLYRARRLADRAAAALRDAARGRILPLLGLPRVRRTMPRSPRRWRRPHRPDRRTRSRLPAGRARSRPTTPRSSRWPGGLDALEREVRTP